MDGIGHVVGYGEDGRHEVRHEDGDSGPGKSAQEKAEVGLADGDIPPHSQGDGQADGYGVGDLGVCERETGWRAG